MAKRITCETNHEAHSHLMISSPLICLDRKFHYSYNLELPSIHLLVKGAGVARNIKLRSYSYNKHI